MKIVNEWIVNSKEFSQRISAVDLEIMNFETHFMEVVKSWDDAARPEGTFRITIEFELKTETKLI